MNTKQMSEFFELVDRLCPNGVEWKPLYELANYEQPSKYIVSNTNYDDAFSTPVLTAGKTFILGYTNDTDGVYLASKKHPVIIFDDFTCAFKWVDFPFKVKSSAIKIITANEEITLLRYIFHMMGKLAFIPNLSDHQRLWISKYSLFKIPLPPLEVQREVVGILDLFTEL
ncbi:MAG: restriction endonuclease subunit S, partial [Acetobacter sp.]|nr:restriction endonuclease subunit S [Acetobacter sp.]